MNNSINYENEERTEYKNYRSINLLSMVRKIYAGILVDRVRRVTGVLSDDEQGALEGNRGVYIRSLY